MIKLESIALHREEAIEEGKKIHQLRTLPASLTIEEQLTQARESRYQRNRAITILKRDITRTSTP